MTIVACGDGRVEGCDVGKAESSGARRPNPAPGQSCGAGRADQASRSSHRQFPRRDYSHPQGPQCGGLQPPTANPARISDLLFDGQNPSLRVLFHFNAARGEYGPGEVAEIVASKMELVRRREAHAYERRRPNGQIIEIRGVPLASGGFVTSYNDVSENRKHQALIADLALTDPLTGLANRRLLREHFQQAIARAKRGEGFAVHYIDLDRFKPINDTYGHDAGDAVLSEVANRLRSTIRDTDTVARIGGDEF